MSAGAEKREALAHGLAGSEINADCDVKLSPLDWIVAIGSIGSVTALAYIIACLYFEAR